MKRTLYQQYQSVKASFASVTRSAITTLFHVLWFGFAKGYSATFRRVKPAFTAIRCGKISGSLALRWACHSLKHFVFTLSSDQCQMHAPI